MKISENALQLCNVKFGKGMFYGFEYMDAQVLEELAEEEANKIFEELLQNNLIDFKEGNVHISALGQHICNMLYEPEQYIYLENTENHRIIKIYIRNTYYLSVIEETHTERKEKEYQFELLPQLELVTSAFVYALYQQGKKNDNAGIQVRGIAWDKDRNCVSELDITRQPASEELPVIINQVTNWMLQNMEKRYKEEYCKLKN